MMTKYISKDKAISIAVANCDKYHFADDAMLEIIADIEKKWLQKTTTLRL